MEIRRSSSYRRPQAGIALISALLLLILLSALAVALLYKVTYEQHLQKADSSNSVAFYGAQAAMEKMTADLDNLFGKVAVPDSCDIATLANTPPDISDVNVTYSEYQIVIPPSNPKCPAPAPGSKPGCDLPQACSSQITQGPNAGLYAAIVPLTLRVTANHASGNADASGNQIPEQVRMIRQVEIAEIPVFQFGVYSDTDLNFFAGPDLDFNGRVHTNQNLFLAEGSTGTLTFHAPIRAAYDVVRDQLSNQLDTSSNGYAGKVLIPTQTSGCDNTNQMPTCRPIALSEPSSSPGSSQEYGNGSGTENANWSTISNTNYNGMILSGSTGAKPLNMAFVQAGVGPIEILRRPAGESPNTSLGESRLYNQAQIRVLLSDDPAELPGGAADGQNIRLANVQTNPSAPDYTKGVPVSPLPPVAKGTNVFFAEGTTVTGVTSEIDWTAAPAAESTLVPAGAPKITGSTWNLLDGYLRVEYRDVNGNYQPVTQEWLEYGFARGFSPPTAASPNSVNPAAILILQQKADRASVWSAKTTQFIAATPNNQEDPGNPKNKPPIAPELLTDPGTGTNYTGAATRNNWYPINFYDVREGELREAEQTVTTCRVGGIMNLVEIDVDNLRKWLAGVGAYVGKSGTSVEYSSQNGYILYFSDRRGMYPNQNLPTPAKNGESGLEDVINTSGSGSPNKQLDDGEDVDQNKQLDNWGLTTTGLGVAKPKNTFATVDCLGSARPNWVSGARHGVRLLDAAQGQLPTRPDNGGGGFTLGSENSAYVLGDYNSNATNGWSGAHASAAVIADTVTLLSNNWTDLESFAAPDETKGRVAGATWYRLAIASGKNMSFKRPTFTPAPPKDYGTDGGVHNFLRFLESWANINANYKGSMASMYYSQYATGVFKCCGMVYQPPIRNYSFDTDFLDMNKLPPGTPRFRDVENVGFQQVF